MAKKEKAFNKIVKARAQLDMYVQHGEAALRGQTHAEFLAEIHEAFEHLMEFRNIINGMVGFDEAPSRAVIPYLSDEVIAEISEG